VSVGAETDDFLDSQLKSEAGCIDDAERVLRIRRLSPRPIGLLSLRGGTVRLFHSVSVDQAIGERVSSTA